MITESERERIYREVEARIPIWRPPAGENGMKKGMTSGLRRLDLGLPGNVSALGEAEFQRLRDRVLERILFELHSIFEIPAESSQVEEAVRQILEDRFSAELACGTGSDYDAGVYARCLFFERWNLSASKGAEDGDRSSEWLKGLHHIRGAGFFRKAPREILGWTRCFLEVEAYHRLDPSRNEERLDRYRVLRTAGPQSAVKHFEDILIWLDMRLMGQSAAADTDAGRLSREVALELEGTAWDVLLPESPLQPVLYVLLRSHQLCLMETLDGREQKRLLQIQANRQIDSLLDLMRLILHKTVGEARLPEPSALLDELQSEGFNIEHQRFRDPYEALLVDLADTERFEEASLRILAPLEELTGDWERDRRIGRNQIEGWYQKLIREAVQDVATFVQACRQPLPRTGVIHRIVRAATTLVLAGRPWPLHLAGENLEEEVRKILPEAAVKHLIRPRKGYELKSRSDLSSLIAGEWSRQSEALQRIAADYSIQGLHDFRHFIGYLLFQNWMERFGPNPANWEVPLRSGELTSSRIESMEWIAATAARWSLELHRAVPHSLEAVQDRLEEICPRSAIIGRLTDGFVLSDGEKGRIYRTLIEELTPVSHRLLVAYGRSRAGMDRLALSARWREELEPAVALLAPTVRSLREGARRMAERYLADFSSPLYRLQLRPCLRSAAEWKAFLAWEVHRWISENGGAMDEPAALHRLKAHLEASSEAVDMPPRTLFNESVTGTLVDFIGPGGHKEDIPAEHLEAVLSLLPRIDCGACGRSSCRAFAVSLMTGQGSPAGCIHLAAHEVERVASRLGEARRSAIPGDGGSLLDVLADRAGWRASAERRRFEKVISVTEQKGRLFLRERLKTLWRKLNPKPRIFKAPSGEELYQGFCLYLGYEAAERLQRDERQLLVDHGVFRLEAEWERVVQSCDWLVLTRRRRQSQPLAQSQDPAWKAREAYGKVLFLHQLTPRDRELVLRHRFERFQDGFSHWWNEDLLDMNLPDFSIRDWEDFSKIIKNAYWHQESSLAAGRVLSMLQEAGERGAGPMVPEIAPVEMLQAYLERLIRQEQAAFEHRRKVHQSHRQGITVLEVHRLRELIEACIDEAGRVEPPHASPEDERKLWLEEVWRRFQREGFAISPLFSCSWEELLPDEQDAVEEELVRAGAAVNRAGRGEMVIASWDQSLKIRSTFLRALMGAALVRRQQERMESLWLEKKLIERSEGRPPLGIIRMLIRERVRRDIDRAGIQEELKAHLSGAAAYPGLIDAWCGDLVHHLACKRQVQTSQGIQPGVAGAVEEDEMDSVLYRFPVFTAFLDRVLDRYRTMDRDRLLHYLFLVAKMEGNLDALTALLREIRETSDVIEAAWLRFTEERLQEGPLPRTVPGSSLGIPLLVSGLKDKEPVNRGLRDGMARGEKRPVAAACRELLQVVRYHVLLQDEERGDLQDVIDDIRRAGYDLGGIDDGALAAAAEREWRRRESLREQRIWIYASVTARLYAAQNAEFQEADRAFHKVRMDLLKDGEREAAAAVHASPQLPAGSEEPGAGRGAADGLGGIVSRRGVALGQIKEEMYRRLSDLLEAERMATFHKRIRQIVEELDRKRVEIQESCYRGRIDSRALFYLLRQHQKGEEDPGWEDFWQFVVDHGLNPLDELLGSKRADREQRLKELDDRFRALLGISLLQWTEEVAAAARQDLLSWTEQQRQALA